MEVTFGRQFIFKFFNICTKKILKIEMSYKIFFSNSRLKINDHFEEVFIKTFLKFFLKKKKKKLVRLSIYFIYCYVFFNKNESNSP